MILTILVFLIILTVLVLIHELGHYLVAKKFGIKVEEFGFGFPPRAFGIKRGETIYSINWLPIGGFVKLYGEDEAGGGEVRKKSGRKSKTKDSDEDMAFFTRPPWQKALVVVAGVVMNIVLAAVIFYAFIFLSGFRTELPLISDHKFFGVNQEKVSQVVIGDVAKDSPADEAGMVPFIRITSVDGEELDDVERFVEVVSSKKGEKVEIAWQNLRTNETSKAVLVPRVDPPKDQGSLGVSLFSVSTAVLTYDTPVQKIFSGVVHPTNLMIYNFKIIGELIGISIERQTFEPVSQGVAGPVGIASITSTILSIENLNERILQLLNLTGLLSISLAFFNILPIPALDGGRLFFILIELVTRKKVNQNFEAAAHRIGLAVLLILIVLITFKDIRQFFSGFFTF